MGQRLRAGWLGIVLTEIEFVPIVDMDLSDTASLIKGKSLGIFEELLR